MSDTSTADQGDQTDTPDTGDDTSPSSSPSPSPPAQPRFWQPPPRMPGPLDAIVGQLFQGRQMGPLPQPAVMAPFDKLQQRAMQREAPYARPTGAFPPWQQSPVQTYLPATPTRDHSQWGTAGQFPNTPNTWELPGIWQGVGGKLSQVGSGNVAEIASRLGPYAGTFMKSYLAGQEARVRVDHERAVDNAWELDRRQTEELKAARDAYALFGGDVTSMTGADEGVKLPNVGNLHDALFAVANKYNDSVLLAALNSGAGGLARAENILKERDAASKDLKASLEQQRKDETAREELAPYLKNGGRTQAGPMRGPVENPPPAPDATVPEDTGEPGVNGGAGTPGPTTPDPGSPTLDPFGDNAGDTGPQAQAQPQKPVRLAQAGASDAPQPGVAQAAAQANPNDTQGWQPTPSQALQQAQQDNATPYGALEPKGVDDLARQAVNDPMFKPGAKGYPGVPAPMQGYVARRKQEIDADLQRIENDSRFDGSTPEKRRAAYNAIRKVDPELANTVRLSVEGSIPMPTSARYQTLREHIAALGQKIDPTFNYQTYASRAKTMQDFTSGTEGRTLTKIGTAYAHIEGALKALDNVPDPIRGEWAKHRWLGGGFMPKWIQDSVGTLNNTINTADSEYEAALVGGKPAQTARSEQAKETDWSSVPAEVIRADLLSKRDALQKRLKLLEGQWATGVGRSPQEMLKQFDRFTKSGQAHGWKEDGTDFDVPGPTPETLGTLQNLSGGAQATPAARSQANTDALNWARQNPNDPRAKEILQELGQ